MMNPYERLTGLKRMSDRDAALMARLEATSREIDRVAERSFRMPPSPNLAPPLSRPSSPLRRLRGSLLSGAARWLR